MVLLHEMERKTEKQRYELKSQPPEIKENHKLTTEIKSYKGLLISVNCQRQQHKKSFGGSFTNNF